MFDVKNQITKQKKKRPYNDDNKDYDFQVGELPTTKQICKVDKLGKAKIIHIPITVGFNINNYK